MREGQDSVSEGETLGERAGEVIGDVAARVAEATDQTQRIAVATQQLSTTITDMVASMEDVARKVAQNTEAGTQIAQTADRLSVQAVELKTLTSRFQT
jgi:methyl-accepting chemotaxis protein